MIYAPDPNRGLEVWVDADFAGGWDPSEADNSDNVYSCTGFVIYYAGCPVFGRVNCRQKSRYQLQKPRIFQCCKL
jgi:hypothetical protein